VTVTAGVDVGNATTEVAFLDGDRLLGVDRVPTRGRKGSEDSLRGAAALVRRLERRLGCRVTQARVAPLRAVDTATMTIPPAPPDTGRLRLLTAGVSTPGGSGAWAGVPLWLDRPLPHTWVAGPASAPAAGAPAGFASPAAGPAYAGAAQAGEPGTVTAVTGVAGTGAAGTPAVAIVPAGFGYARAAEHLRALLAGGVPLGAVLVGGDEGVLIFNRLGVVLPVIDQVDLGAVAGCDLVAVEVRPPGHPLTLLADPVALADAFSLAMGEAADAAVLCRTLVDFSNAVVGRAAVPGRAGGDSAGGPADCGSAAPGLAIPGAAGARSASAAAAGIGRGQGPWVEADGERITLRSACAQVAGWPVGTVRALGSADGRTETDDLFALDLAQVADAATARRGSLGSAALVASLRRLSGGADHAAVLTEMLGIPVHSALSEPVAARRGALTTPGARPDAAVVDLGAGTVDVIAVHGEVVAAGAGELLTAAVAETLRIPRAAADWVKRGPCLRVDGGQRFEAEDGSRGFLDRPAPAAAAGMLAARGPAGLIPFDRNHSPAEWRAIRLRLKEAVFAVNLRRALGTLGGTLPQVLLVGGPAGDDELLGVLLRALPGDIPVGRASVGGTLAGAPAGHRYAAAVGLGLPGPTV
jgi:Diol dehydratase reactivase ATPase-like domain/DD-reactivating factor swiveling domain